MQLQIFLCSIINFKCEFVHYIQIGEEKSFKFKLQIRFFEKCFPIIKRASKVSQVILDMYLNKLVLMTIIITVIVLGRQLIEPKLFK